MAGQIIFVPTPLGNLGDITIRAISALETCDLVACEDTRRTGLLLKHLNINKPLQRFDDHAGERETSILIDALSAGKTVAYCSDAGMPGISDPGFELARLAAESGALVNVLPGPSVVTLAVVASRLPTHAFGFFGYVPAKSEARRSFILKLASKEETSLVFESPHRIDETLNEISAVMPDRELALGRELTKLHESWYRGTATQVLTRIGTERRGEMVLLIAGADAKRSTMEVFNSNAEPDVLPEWAGKFLDAAREGGMTLRDSVKPLARHLGKSPSDIYKMAVERLG